MRGTALLSLLVLAACGTATTPVAGSSGSPSAGSSAAASPVGTTPSPSAIASPTATATAHPTTYTLPPVSPAPTAPAGQCYLPVFWITQGANATVNVGFFRYPDGVVQGATSIAVSPASATFFQDSPTYDGSVGRWLPVGAQSISPDGLRFAYADYDLPPSPAPGMAGEQMPHMVGALATTGRVHIVDTRTGQDQILFSGSPTYAVVGFTTGGIYLAQIALTMDGALLSGLYLLNPAGGTPQPVGGGGRQLDRSGWSIAGGAAWGVDFSAGGGLTGGNRLLRMDLKTGVVQEWLTKPEGAAVSLLGFDAQGNPLAFIYSSGYSGTGSPAPAQAAEVWVLTAPDTGKMVYQNSDTTASFPAGPTYTDSRGVWISGRQNSLWLYTGPGVQVVSVPETGWVGVGGRCV